MQENLPKTQGRLILDDKTFLCPILLPTTLAQVSSGLQHMHACMHAEVSRDQILRNRPTRGNGHHQGNQFLKEAAERRTRPRSASGHTGKEKNSRTRFCFY